MTLDAIADLLPRVSNATLRGRSYRAGAPVSRERVRQVVNFGERILRHFTALAALEDGRPANIAAAQAALDLLDLETAEQELRKAFSVEAATAAAEVTEGEVIATAWKIERMLAAAMLKGSTFTCTYNFKEAPTVRDLAEVEKVINGLVRGTLGRTFKSKARMPKFFLDLEKGTWIDDGDHTLTVTLDFAKLLPFERGAEHLELAAQLLAKNAEAGVK